MNEREKTQGLPFREEWWSPTLYLPNKNGNYVETRVPNYIRDILYSNRHGKRYLNISYVEGKEYGYKLTGWNQTRPGYGIEKDMEAFQKWAKRYYTEICDIHFHKQPRNYFATFTMYDPLALVLEKAGLIAEYEPPVFRRNKSR